MRLTDAQLKAVRYYEGDVQGDDPFWGDPKAYVTLNALFYDGIETEKRRVREGKYLNPELVRDPERLLSLCRDLISAFRVPDLSRDRTTYRVERYADYLETKSYGRTISFTSTSSGGFLKAYGDRIGIALMEFHIPAGIPCFAYQETLGEEYLKEEEQEILLPPGLTLKITERPLTDEERTIRDAEGNEPLIFCTAEVTGIEDFTEQISSVPGGNLALMRVYTALNEGQEPDPEDLGKAVRWKEYFSACLLRDLCR